MMKKILTIIGARPQIIKAAAISRAIGSNAQLKLQEDLLHTGQHYDSNMSEVFFNEMGIPTPRFQLSVGSGSHGKQTGSMLQGIEEVLIKESYDAVLVYGDTNSTLAGAMAASKLHIPLIHVEAGLRSFNKKMPEEINRIMCDHASTLLFSPTQEGIKNLQREGLQHQEMPWSMDRPGIFHTGDIMFDNSLYFSESAAAKKRPAFLGSDVSNFLLATVHRDTNTDDEEKLNAILLAMGQLTLNSNMHVVFPMHPRTRAKLSSESKRLLSSHPMIIITEPLSFLEMVWMEKNCSMIVTDSGGVQKEAFFFKKPCIILREQTEWVELVSNGNAILTGPSEQKIIQAYENLRKNEQSMTWPAYFGDGKAAEFICETISSFLHYGDTL